MPQELYITRMAEAGLIFGKPAYHGCTVWREYGLELIDQLLNTIAEVVRSIFGDTCLHIRHGMFNNHEFYSQLHRLLGDYQNDFEINLSGKRVTIRSDTVESNIRQLLTSAGTYDTVLSLTSIYRRSKGRALFVDQCIFPTFSINHISSNDAAKSRIVTIKACLDTVFDKLLLPRLWVFRPKGFESYGDYLLMPLMRESDTQLTVCSTVFMLSKPFRDICCVRDQVFDVGFTSKILAVYFNCQASRNFVVLPSSVAPVQCALLNEAAEDPEIVRYLESECCRHSAFRVAERAKQRGSGRAMKMGIPLQVYRSHKGQWLIRRCFDDCVSELSNLEEIKSNLLKSDSLIWNHNNQMFEAAIQKNILVELSEESPESYGARLHLDLVGQLYQAGQYERNRFLFVSKTATGTIREKI